MRVVVAVAALQAREFELQMERVQRQVSVPVQAVQAVQVVQVQVQVQMQVSLQVQVQVKVQERVQSVQESAGE